MATPPYALGYFDNDTKGYRLLGNLVGFHSSHNSAMRRPLRLWWRCPSAPPLDSSPASPSASLCCDCGGMLSILIILGNIDIVRLYSTLTYTLSRSLYSY